MAKPRLHAHLLFYGFDAGTWSDPPPPSVVDCWKRDPPGAFGNVPAPPASPAEASTGDEWSEAKGSESESLPDSTDGYASTARTPPSWQPRTPPPGFVPVTPATLPHGGATPTAPPSYAPGAIFATAPSRLPKVPPGSFEVPRGTPHNHGLFAGGLLSTNPQEAVQLPLVFEAPGLASASEALRMPLCFEAPRLAPSPEAPGLSRPAEVPEAPGLALPSDAEQVPSLGSFAHATGQCSRCCFFPKGRCHNGFLCQFCHYDHEKRPRTSKKRRQRRGDEGDSDECEVLEVED